MSLARIGRTGPRIYGSSDVATISRGLGRTYPEEVGHRVASRPVADGDAWVRSALAQFGQVAGVCRAGLALAEGGGRRLLFCASDRANDRRVDWCEIDAYDHVPLNHSVRTGEAVVP